MNGRPIDKELVLRDEHGDELVFREGEDGWEAEAFGNFVFLSADDLLRLHAWTRRELRKPREP